MASLKTHLSLSLLASVLFCLLDFGCALGAAGYVQPANCRTYECPSYDVVHSQTEFEIRKYKKSVWMSTPPIPSSSFKVATNIGFMSLFDYIQGKNADGARLDMTAPVLIDVAPSTGPFCNSTFAAHFYVPAKYQSGPPRSDQVRPEVWPQKNLAAVRRFGGFMGESANIAAQASALTSSLKGTPWEAAAAAAAMANKRGYTVAGYNSPFEYTGRVNEVMFLF